MQLIANRFTEFEALAEKLLPIAIPNSLAHLSMNKDIVGRAVKRVISHNQKLGFNWVHFSGNQSSSSSGWSSIGWNTWFGDNAKPNNMP
jgi:hypothetical protein